MVSIERIKDFRYGLLVTLTVFSIACLFVTFTLYLIPSLDPNYPYLALAFAVCACGSWLLIGAMYSISPKLVHKCFPRSSADDSPTPRVGIAGTIPDV